jgi:hypothetical protein
MSTKKNEDVPLDQAVLTPEELQEIREQVKRQLKTRQDQKPGVFTDGPVAYTR